MSRLIQPLCEAFLYASPEAMPQDCYRRFQRQPTAKSIHFKRPSIRGADDEKHGKKSEL
ncbi:MAG: hypothetical protein GY934_10925 [Gammaproteobacteria bacterium]|nr:hypothetical protein [Gammaproteobacteria bacterium]